MNDITDQHDAQIRRYLANKMDGEEKAGFEVRMIEDPDLLERVQLLEALQRELHAEERHLLAPESIPRFSVLPFRHQLRQPVALAASVLVAALGVHALLPAGSTAPAAVPVGALVLLEARRDDSMPEFTGPGPYLLQVGADLPLDVDTVSLTLTDLATGNLLLEQAGVKVDADGWVRLLYTRPLDGTYRIDVKPAPGVAAGYSFVVRNP